MYVTIFLYPQVFYIGGLFNNGLMTFIGDRMGRKKVCLATDIYLLFYFESLFSVHIDHAIGGSGV